MDENRYIMVVDDHEAELLAEILRPLGFSVRVASDGQEALEFLHVMSGICQVLITDFDMPRLSGKELIMEVLRQGLSVENLILVSGHAPEEIGLEEIHGINAGRIPFFFLGKPYPLTKLKHLLAQFGISSSSA